MTTMGEGKGVGLIADDISFLVEEGQSIERRRGGGEYRSIGFNVLDQIKDGHSIAYWRE